MQKSTYHIGAICDGYMEIAVPKSIFSSHKFCADFRFILQ